MFPVFPMAPHITQGVQERTLLATWSWAQGAASLPYTVKEKRFKPLQAILCLESQVVSSTIFKSSFTYSEGCWNFGYHTPCRLIYII